MDLAAALAIGKRAWPSYGSERASPSCIEHFGTHSVARCAGRKNAETLRTATRHCVMNISMAKGMRRDGMTTDSASACWLMRANGRYVAPAAGMGVTSAGFSAEGQERPYAGW